MSRTFCDQFAHMFDQLVPGNQRYVVCGDFNCPSDNCSILDRNLVDVLQRYNLLQHVDTATHVGGM